MKKIALSSTREQAQSALAAVSVYLKVLLNQFSVIEELAEAGTIPLQNDSNQPRALATDKHLAAMLQSLVAAERLVGAPSGSEGMNVQLSPFAQRALSVQKALDFALQEQAGERISVELNLDEGQTLVNALDTYSRILIGQFQIAEEVYREYSFFDYKGNDQEEFSQRIEVCNGVRDHINMAKAVLGYPVNGSHGIGHPHIDISGLRAYELKKVVSKVIAEDRDPNPAFKTVHYDGLTLRYTDDPEATAEIKEVAEAGA